jgi:hypothetical protein
MRNHFLTPHLPTMWKCFSGPTIRNCFQVSPAISERRALDHSSTFANKQAAVMPPHFRSR